MMLTICYVTSRREPMIQWFFDSLHAQCKGDYSEIRIVIVDFYAQAHLEWTEKAVAIRKSQFREWCKCPNYLHIAPKPTPWQGPYRLAKNDYFAAANSRNTGICHCPDLFIAFVDDLSVLMPTWLGAAREAMAKRYIACGAFRKVNKIRFEDGKWNFEDHQAGYDQRWDSGSDDKAIPCAPQWFFGCSLVAPIEAFLRVNGYPEVADGMGYEDCITGEMIALHGYQFRYDRRMMTYEDEGRHHIERPMLRVDKGVSPNDKSHALLKLLEGKKESGNAFNLREMRTNTLNNLPFTSNWPVKETKDWYDGQPISEM